MTTRWFFVLLMLLICIQGAALAQYGGALPTVCVIDAHDKTGQSIGTAGKGFALRIGSNDILITTAHGICELCGPTTDPQTALSKIGSVVLLNFAEKEIAKAGKCLVVGSPDGGYNSDLLAFELPPGTQIQSMYLAPGLPPVGSKVWVLSKEGHNFSTDPAVDKYPGTVESATISEIAVRMDKPLSAYHASGSPVINSKNQVVGMLCATGDGRKSIGCNPGLAIWQRLGPSTTAPRARPTSGIKTYR